MIIRAAIRSDVPEILQLIVALATYERESDAVVNSVDELTADLFDNPVCEAIVCEWDKAIVGFALFYTAYSTWKGKCMYLEDLYVVDEFRRHGIGDALFDRVVAIAKERNYRRMDWQVLEWNDPAIAFYKRKEAVLDPEWINGRLFFDERS